MSKLAIFLAGASIAFSAIAQTEPDAAELARRAELRRQFYEAESQRLDRERMQQEQEQAAAQARAAEDAQRRAMLIQLMRPPPLVYRPVDPPPIIVPPAPRLGQQFSCRTYRNLGGQVQTDCF